MTENCHVKAKFSNKDGLSGWPTLTPNGSLVLAESGGGAVPPGNVSGCFSRNLSRRARRHGAVFAVMVQPEKVTCASRYNFD